MRRHYCGTFRRSGGDGDGDGGGDDDEENDDDDDEDGDDAAGKAAAPSAHPVAPGATSSGLTSCAWGDSQVT